MDSLSTTVPWPSDRQPLAERLAAEMVLRWQEGQRPRAIDYLERHPELSGDKQAALLLIYEEFCLREEYGEPASFDDVLLKYPDWRDEFEILLECHRLVKPIADAASASAEADERTPPSDYVILDELGRGTQGVVYLATQGSLANRPVVLKVASRVAEEHLALARLQHTSIVPLYAVHDDPERNTRTLCMPYFGGATLKQLLDLMAGKPVSQRTGKDLMTVLDKTQEDALLTPTSQGRTRAQLESVSYELAICWMGRRLAEALQYAHERGLVHLDLKPSNVLFTADGEPMLLDFHSAQSPIRPGDPAPDWLGGTPLYMSPEQQQALAALKVGEPIRQTVDGRSDIYSLGLILFEALGGPLFGTRGETLPLRPANLPAAPGLRDIVARCLAVDPLARYASAGDLADDLRRHMDDLPLRGVPNRSLVERYRKWRRRRPFDLRSLVMVSGLVVAVITFCIIWVNSSSSLQRDAEAAFARGDDLLSKKNYKEAATAFERGLESAQKIGDGSLINACRSGLARAQRALLLEALHQYAEQLRFLAGDVRISARSYRTLDETWQQLWQKRDRLLRGEALEHLSVEAKDRARDDLLDAGLIWADLSVRHAAPFERASRQEQALAIIEELGSLEELGDRLHHSPVLVLQRQALLTPHPLSPGAKGGLPVRTPRTPWEQWVTGRLHLQAGDLARAAELFERAVDGQPEAFWPNFHLGVCAFRLQEFDRACEAFRVCVALAPRSAECYFNLGRAESERGHNDAALRAFDRALDLNPHLAAASLSRGLVHFNLKRYAIAGADLQRALADGAEPAVVHYNMALVHLAAENHAAARVAVNRALQADPQHESARKLQTRLAAGPP